MTTKTDTEQLRAKFEAWTDNHYYLSELNNIYLDDDYVDPEMQAAWEGYQAGRASLQSQVKNDRTLFCDLKTDEEKSAFFLSGRGYETGVISRAIQHDVAMAYHRCSEYRKELEALQPAEQKADVTQLAEALKELITWIPSADTYRRLGFDPEAPMRALGLARAALAPYRKGEA